MVEQAWQPMKELYNETDEYLASLSYDGFGTLADEATGLDFEGTEKVEDEYFSEDQWETTHEFQKVTLWHRDSKDASDLEVSRILNKPLAVMTGKIMGVILDKPDDIWKYMLYSAHDDTVLNMMRFLKIDFAWVPFASTITIELKYSEKCVKAGREDTMSCFGVSVLSNGAPMRFEDQGCTGDVFTLNGCKWEEFYALVKANWYTGPGAPDLNQACLEKPTGQDTP